MTAEPRDWSEFARCRRCKNYGYGGQVCSSRHDQRVTPDTHCSLFEAATEDRQAEVEEHIQKQNPKSAGAPGWLEKVGLRKAKKASNQDEEPVIEKSLIIDENSQIMVEQCYKENRGYFVIYNHKTGIRTTATEYRDVAGVIYRPLNGEEVQKGAIMLPSEPMPYDDAQLDTDILAFIYRWLDISDNTRQFALWNIKRSWVFDRFHTLSYLRALGDTGRGKSRFLDTLGILHYKPVWTAGATTAAPIFRLIERWKPTLIIDEADLKKSDESQDIIKIINMGYERGKFVIRCDQNDAQKLQLFDAYCPKVFATRKLFDDKAVESRCITEVMQGTSRKDITFTLTPAFYADALRLRNQLLMWRFKNYWTIREVTVNSDTMQKLEPRLQQIVGSFASLFANDTKQWHVFEQYIVGQQERITAERQESFEGAIVGGIYALLQDKTGKLEDVAIDAQEVINAGTLTGRGGDLMKPRALTPKLRALGFKTSDRRRIGSEIKRCIPLEREHLCRLFQNYGYDVTMLPIVTVVTVSPGGQQTAINSVVNDDCDDCTSPRKDRHNSHTGTTEYVPDAGAQP